MSKAYKDSGIPWIGEIPNDWKVNKINQLFSIIGSGTTPKATNDSNFVGNINWIQSGDINGGFIVDCKNKIAEQVLYQYSALKLYKQPFIIVAMYGASVGNISISKIDGCVNQACCVMGNSNQCFEFLFYAIKSAKDYLIYRAEGGGQPNISQDKLKNLRIPIPPLPTQQRIADFLDRKCAEIDELAALQETMIAELKRYKQSVITEAVTKGLDPDVPMKDSGVEWIGEIPERWSMSKLKKVAKTNSGSTPKSILNDDTSNIVWIRTTDINEDIVFDSSIHLSHFEMNGCSCPILPKGTCVVAMYGGAGTIGKSGMLGIDATINQALCSLTPEKVDSFFLFYYLQAIRRHWMMFAVGTRKDPNISQEIVKNMPIPIPPLTEQRAIADYLDEKCAEIEELIAIKQQKIEALKEYKKSVIFEYVTGKKEI